MARLCARQQGSELRAEPERVHSAASRVGDPKYFVWRREILAWPRANVDFLRRLPVAREAAMGIHKKRTISQALPEAWPEEKSLWDQVARLIVQAAMEERAG